MAIDVCELLREAVGGDQIKDNATWLFSQKRLNAVSESAVDVQEYNAVSVQVLVSGTNPSATITILGAPAIGAVFLPLPDPNAVQSALTSSQIFDVVVGANFVKAEISNIAGTYGNGEGWTIIVTPYIAFGSSNIVAVVS